MSTPSKNGDISLVDNQGPKEQMQPPEGKWGWMIVVGMAIVFITTTGQIGTFGLIFGDIVDEIGVHTTGATVILNSFVACANLTGLLTNQFLKTVTYRVIAVIGGLMFAVGVMLTAFSKNMIHIMITYSVIAGIGLGLVAPASYYAFNSYFLQRRGLAMGVCQAVIGLGFMGVPFLVDYLLQKFGFHGTMFILGGLSLHSIIGALLYHPLHWHAKICLLSPSANSDPSDIDSMPLSKDTSQDVAAEPSLSMDIVPEEEDDLSRPQNGNRLSNGYTQINIQVSDYDESEHVVISRRGSLVMSALKNPKSSPLLLHTLEEEDHPNSVYNSTTVSAQDVPEPIRKWTTTKRPTSLSLTNFASNILMFDNSMADVDLTPPDSDTKKKKKRRTKVQVSTDGFGNQQVSLLEHVPDEDIDESDNEQAHSSEMKHSVANSWFHAISEIVDLNFLKDAVYVNIIFGLSFSFVCDTNFFALFPYYLTSQHFSGTDIAICLSIVTGSDVIARLVLPWLFNQCYISSRSSYLIGCLTSAIARSIFASMDTFTSVAVMSGVIGFLRGAMVVNLSLTIIEYCNTEHFTSAYSLYLLMNAITTVLVGPLVGVVRDASNSFPICIHVLSALMVLCAFAWLLEYFILWHRSGNKTLVVGVRRRF